MPSSLKGEFHHIQNGLSSSEKYEVIDDVLLEPTAAERTLTQVKYGISREYGKPLPFLGQTD